MFSGGDFLITPFSIKFLIAVVNGLEALRVSVREGASYVELNRKPFYCLATL